MIHRAFNRPTRILAVTLLAALLSACGVSPQKVTVPVVASVDLQRFMGPWYVIGVIPTFIEKNAYDAVERYDLRPDGTIATTFTFRQGGFDGEPKRYTPTGFVRDATHARWGMQFVWPIKAEFLIAYLDPGYTQTVIARSARDYVWIMARTPTIPEEDFQRHVERLRAWGYDTAKLRRVPHRR